jgi:hypothetical protein
VNRRDGDAIRVSERSWNGRADDAAAGTAKRICAARGKSFPERINPDHATRYLAPAAKAHASDSDSG